MSLDSWLTYVTAYAVISLIPGPSVLMVVGQALTHGRRAALRCILGDVAGGVVVMALSYAGVGVLLATSALAFAVLKWAGVTYMAALGLAQIRAAARMTDVALPPPPARQSLRAGFLTGVLNPKAILFYMAFLAQFIDPSAAPLPQLGVLMVSSSVVVAVVLGGYALLAARLRDALSDLRARRRMGYAGGTCLLGGSAALALAR